ncbi:MAG: hypothetical protein ACFFAQ_08995 [Promethearchaeota archaeon]
MFGVPSPAPALIAPSPDGDGIITLQWSLSYGASSYKVYRSDSSRSGPYTLIATTSSLSYTDTTTDGTWWYYVRAYNSNGYNPSNIVCVVVYLPSEPTILLGSTQRFFPREDTSRLGYTIYTYFAHSLPMIDFKIYFNVVSSDSFDIVVKVDEIEVLRRSKTYISDSIYETDFQTQILSSFYGHIIEIVIEGYDFTHNTYRLEYLNVSNLVFAQFIYDDGDYYNPTIIKSENESMDYGTVALNTLLTNLYNSDGEIDVYNPWFFTSLVAAIDDDVESTGFPVLSRDYYIHKIKLQFRILDPNGEYLTLGKYSVQEEETSAEADPDPSNQNDQVERLIWLLTQLFVDMIPGYIDWNYIVDYLSYLTGGESLTASTLIHSVESDHFYVEWTVGLRDYGSPGLFDYDAGVAPRQTLKELSLWTMWDLNLQNKFGDYQVEINWELDIREYVQVFRCDNYIIVIIMYTYHQIFPAFTLTGTEYINFNYA